MAVFLFVPSFPVRAEEEQKTVRVGWYETPFNTTDEYGRKSGYAYEYQRKIAAYTGWTYEYVEGSWPELMQKLETGEIDLMSDVSYTEERAEQMLYASLPMGTETYYIYVTAENTEITSDDLNTLAGKQIGITKNSIQAKIFREFAGPHNIEAQLVELGGSEEESIQRLLSGELDAFITLDAYGDPGRLVPICKIGSSDFYFAVNKSRPDLLSDLNYAMSRIQDENTFYNLEMYEKYLGSSGANQYLSAEEKAWLSRHGKIRVGYQDNYLAFCAKDSAGQLTGALKDYLDFASSNMENAEITFEAVCYPTASSAMEALKAGEVDCMFPANLTDYDGEVMGVVMSQPLMSSEMLAVVRADDQKEFLKKSPIRVAVNEGNPNYDMFLADHFPAWQRVYFADTPTCLDAVAAGDADCLLISSYRYTNISKQCEKLDLTTVTTGVDMDYCLAIRDGNTELYSILAKVTGIVPVSAVNASLTYYSTEDAKFDIAEYLKDHIAIFMTIVAAILLVIILLLVRSIRAERKAVEEAHLLDEMNRLVNYDALTSVRNKGAFNNYIKMIQERIDRNEEVEYAACILDCNNLKTINDKYGHEKGDEYLKASCRLICQTFRHSAVFRIGGDEFAVIMMNDDYANREQLARQFSDQQYEIRANTDKPWEQINIAFGIAEYDPKTDRRTVTITVRRADKIMYENKRTWKAAH